MELKLALFNKSPAHPVRNGVLFPVADRLRTALKKLEPTQTQLRKFVVLRNDKDAYIVIGPRFVDEQSHADFYMHKHLRQAALHFLDRDGSKKYQTKGGGQVALVYKEYLRIPGWTAEFGGASSDYGVYDPAVLLHAQEIAEWMGMHTTFNWREIRAPAKNP